VQRTAGNIGMSDSLTHDVPHSDGCLAPPSATAQGPHIVSPTEYMMEVVTTQRQIIAVLLAICNGLGIVGPAITELSSSLAVPSSAATSATTSSLNSPITALRSLSLASGQASGASNASSANSSMRSGESCMIYISSLSTMLSLLHSGPWTSDWRC
jgi:hypothetical protein